MVLLAPAPLVNARSPKPPSSIRVTCACEFRWLADDSLPANPPRSDTPFGSVSVDGTEWSPAAIQISVQPPATATAAERELNAVVHESPSPFAGALARTRRIGRSQEVTR
jgi:hypothetical protein